MLEKCDIEPSLFDEKEIIEIVDSDEKCLRYMLCKKPETMRSETAPRLSLIDAAVTRLNDIAKVKRKRDPQKVCARIGRVFAKYRIEKFFTWKVEESGSLHFSLNNDVIDTEQALDGCYVIRADISRDILNKEEAVAGYMALRHVEKAFRNLKTVALEMRPIYHKTDERIRAHIFLCFLSYYLLWHAQQRLKPLFDKDGKGSKRHWSVAVVIERLKSLRRNQLLVEGIAVRKICTKPDKEQAEILDLLGVNFL